MIEGVTILSKEMIYNYPEWTIILLLLGFVGGLFGFIFLIGTESMGFMLLMVISISSLMLGTHYNKKLAEPTERYEYKVIINESVSFTELYNNYEIVDQEGQIYTIKDKKKG